MIIRNWLNPPRLTVVGIAILFCVSLFNADCSGCGNRPISQVASPDGRHVAVVFERDCGATTWFSTQVSVLSPRDSPYYGAGNLLVVDDNKGAAPTGPGGGPVVTARWKDSRTLIVTYSSKARTYLNVTKLDGVRVEYATE